MTINETQLAIWSTAPSDTKFSFTYGEIDKALKKHLKLPDSLDYVVYLQGSYANSTNIKVDSDVDVVVELVRPWSRDISKMHPSHQERYISSVIKSSYELPEFKKVVYAALVSYFGLMTVKEGTKTIKVFKDVYNKRVKADVLVCIQYRDYTRFETHKDQHHIPGVRFTNNKGEEIINYPKVHIKNGEAKNHVSRTSEKYKHLIRIFKNIKRKLIEEKQIGSDIAPSYFIESVIYNVPDTYFVGNSYQKSVENIFKYIFQECDTSTMTTVSQQHMLFGDKPWQWNKKDASTFFVSAYGLFNDN